ncbi:phosphate/phosphite/phosphonate ABC transporter substrate-binding protein [Thiohalomonas denitrificans]|uniref:Phosphonate transport system substrate-binding protein n=1 Tax=Thiohalomonas denitrificans TaxID=415747 RepID=A0A1G5QDP4_9GAMM|nr:phosphate/phosphite/phosphonate ABC transporter substrate-binding protein [Thiohalomonas denitrificans]SCZ59983.1 phosphonate transport system substrate-binding protein [Thiohalomonas denitrificans]
MPRATLLVLLSIFGIAGAEPLKLGVHPYLPATELVSRFTPLAEYLEDTLERPVEIVVSSSYESHIEQVATGEFTLALLGPIPYVVLTRDHGTPPILAALQIDGHAMFHGVIITREESPLQRLEDLAGRKFAFVDPNSTMGYVVPLSILERHGIPLEKLDRHAFLNSHENVAIGVLLGRYDAGAVKDETYGKYRDRGLRALAVTSDIPEHLFVAGYQVEPQLVKSLRAALLKLPQTPDGEEVLRAIKPDLTGLVPIHNRQYDALRQMLQSIGTAGE